MKGNVLIAVALLVTIVGCFIIYRLFTALWMRAIARDLAQRRERAEAKAAAAAAAPAAAADAPPPPPPPLPLVAVPAAAPAAT
jgi:hypothetical protein